MAARAAGESVESVAQQFGVCSKTVRIYHKRASQGELQPRPRPGKVPLLAPEQEAAFLSMVGEKPDWTVDQLCDLSLNKWRRKMRGNHGKTVFTNDQERSFLSERVSGRNGSLLAGQQQESQRSGPRIRRE